jgi:hypothetical protein
MLPRSNETNAHPWRTSKLKGTAAIIKIFILLRQLQNSKKGVTPAKAGVQKFLKRLDSRFRGNDIL